MNTPMMKELQRQRENTHKCLDILNASQTKSEILAAFQEMAFLLKQANDPTAAAAEQAYSLGKGLPKADVVKVKEDFIRQFENFLASTEQASQKISRAPAGQSYQPAYAAPSQTIPSNGLAIASLILAIVSLPLTLCYGCGFFIAIAAFIFGLLGYRQIKESAGAQKGEGLAQAGMIVGGFGTLVGMVMIILFIFGFVNLLAS